MSVSTKLQRIAKLAREDPSRVFTSLHHHIDLTFLKEAFRRTRKDGAVGVDGRSAREYEVNLEENLTSLLERLKSGTYRAPPVRRVYIPKDKGGTRPIGITTFEDKVLQRAVTMILEAIYEQDFRDCSHGFRPGRGAHDAIEVLWKATMDVGGGFVLDIDVQGFFDSLDTKHLKSFLDQRVRDGVLRRVIHKWLHAGVDLDGVLSYPGKGTPQGGVVSPMLANIFLHNVLDTWFEDEVRPLLRGGARLARYADDFVIVCRLEEDARRMMAVLPKRFGKYGLTLHPDKSRLVDFRRPRQRRGPASSSPGSFSFLGFTFFWGKSRKGKMVVQHKTSMGSMTKGLKRVDIWCRRHRHRSVAEQFRYLMAVLRGHANYFGLIGNTKTVGSFDHWVRRTWFKWLRRRGQKRLLTWARFELLLERYPLFGPRVSTRVRSKAVV